MKALIALLVAISMAASVVVILGLYGSAPLVVGR